MAEFARITVVGPEDRAADVSVPLGRPAAEIVDQVSAVLDLDPIAEEGWQLAALETGVVPAHAVLREIGTVDGDVLHIVAATEGVAAPEIFSAVDVISHHIDGERQMWNSPARHVAVVGYAGLLVVVAAIAFAVTGGFVAAAGAAALALFMLATYAAPEPARNLVWIAPICAAAALAAVFHSQGWPILATGTVGGALTGIAIVTFVLAPARWAIVACTGLTGITAVICAAAISLGINATALSAWSAPVLLILLTYAGRLSVGWSGLGAVVAAGEEQSPSSEDRLPARPTKAQIIRRTVIATDLVDGIVWATCGAAITAVVVLAVTGTWEQSVFAAYVGLAFLLRSRSFSEVRHVAPIIGVAVTGAFVVPVALITSRIGDSAPFLSAIATMVIALLLGVVVLFFGFYELPPVSAARVAKVWNVLDTLVLLGLLPMLFWAQGIYEYILGTELSPAIGGKR